MNDIAWCWIGKQLVLSLSGHIPQVNGSETLSEMLELDFSLFYFGTEAPCLPPSHFYISIFLRKMMR